MKILEIQLALGAVAALLSTPALSKGSGPYPLDVLHRRHQHGHRRAVTSPRAGPFENGVSRRAATCPFPTNVGLVAVTPDQQNGGWAMSPDQPCKLNSYCPYACPPGQVMAQWDPSATAYTYPQSMNGGLHCNADGTVSKPFPDKPYCVPGVGTVKVQNNFEDILAICQTVLPGNEAMLIPTAIENFATLAVPGMSYWCHTAAHYYVNPPGVTTEEGCIWGDESKPHGNWSPYVTGANQDATGNTYVTLGWNPIYIVSGLAKTLPTFGLRIECDGNCVGTPCSIDPSVNGLNKVTSNTAAQGAGGASFCVVTAPKGVTAHVIVFDIANPHASAPSGSTASSPSAIAPVASVPSSASKVPVAPSPSAASPPPVPSSSSTTVPPVPAAATTTTTTTTISSYATVVSSSTTSATTSTTTAAPGVSFFAGIFHQNDTTNGTTVTVGTRKSTSTMTLSSATASPTSGASSFILSTASLGLACLAAMAMLF